MLSVSRRIDCIRSEVELLLITIELDILETLVNLGHLAQAQQVRALPLPVFDICLVLVL